MLEKLLEKLEGWGEAIVLHLPNLGLAAAMVAAAWILSIVVGKLIDRLLPRISAQASLNALVRKLVRLLIVAFGLIVALQVLDLEKAATTFLAGAGILGLALGFAFQDVTANLIAGIYMAIREVMRPGDLVETNKQLGIVHEIHLRSTTLTSLDGKTILIPNRKIFEDVLINYSQRGELRVDMSFGVSYGDDLARARQIAIDAVNAIDRLPDRDVELFYTRFGASAVDLELRFWIRFRGQPDFLAARSAAIQAIRRAFAEHAITIPFPITTLDFHAHGGERLRDHLERAKA